jgi:hypothetical protein
VTAARSAAPAVAVGAGALLVVAATVVGIAVEGVATVGACTVGCELETTGAGEVVVVEIAGAVSPAVNGAAALWFREQPVTSVARIATPATATADLVRVT